MPEWISTTLDLNHYGSAIAQRSAGQVFLEEGIKLYERQDYQGAATQWKEAETHFAASGKTLSRALTLSNLSLAYQHLGRWEESGDTAERGLILLQQNPDDGSRVYLEVLAKVWNTLGRLHWSQGHFEPALEAWQKAERNYAQADQLDSALYTKLNQSRALQGLGLSRRAEEELQGLIQILEDQPDSDLKAAGFLHFGQALRSVGDFERSREVLQEGLTVADQPARQRSLLLELGNTERALSDKAIAIGKVTESQEHSACALQFYQEATASNEDREFLQPQLNQLSLLVELGRWPEALQLSQRIRFAFDEIPINRTAIDAQLNYVHSLSCLKQLVDQGEVGCAQVSRQPYLRDFLNKEVQLETPSWSELTGLITRAIEQAQVLEDPLAESHALGQLGGLFEIQGEWEIAQDLTQQALIRLQQGQAPNLRYQWEWQLGRVLDQQGDLQGALKAYQSAVDSLTQVRSDLLTITADVQFSFRDNAEPVYRGLVDLLLRAEGKEQPSQENLQRAIETIDALQLAELENFLGCSLRESVRVDQNLDEIDPTAGFVFPIILSDRLAVIYMLPGQNLRYVKTAIQQEIIERTIDNFRRAIVRRDASQVIENGQALYQWLIKPFEREIEDSTVETLVFLLDGKLRNIPISALYDGAHKQYVIEKSYSTALTPNLQLFDLKSKPEPLQALGAGITKSLEAERLQFTGLEADNELENVAQSIPTTIRLDSQFTRSKLQEDLLRSEFSLVHLATHGSFSSDPWGTFILVQGEEENQGELIRTHDLYSILESVDRARLSRIDTLVLSACQTASGDNRAPLGLAGIALRSGAKATLATLWKVSDASASEFSKHFYSRLAQKEVSRAEALHYAQLELVNRSQFQNPFYWAAYVLTGNWQ